MRSGVNSSLPTASTAARRGDGVCSTFRVPGSKFVFIVHVRSSLFVVHGSTKLASGRDPSRPERRTLNRNRNKNPEPGTRTWNPEPGTWNLQSFSRQCPGCNRDEGAHDQIRINSRHPIVGHDAETARQFLEPRGRKWLHDVEDAERQETNERPEAIHRQ